MLADNAEVALPCGEGPHPAVVLGAESSTADGSILPVAPATSPTRLTRCAPGCVGGCGFIRSGAHQALIGMAQALDEVGILDLSGGIAGPLGVLQLAQHGADVIKVEPPGGRPDRVSPASRVYNRSRRSI